MRTRFAPSPTGLLHVGNGYSALRCQQWAQRYGAELLLRIEDIDQTRCRPQFTDAILRDLRWLGIRWQQEVVIQSRRMACYRRAVEQLQSRDLLYPCFCSRAEIRRQLALSAPHHILPRYPGTCRRLSGAERRLRMQSEPHAWRLDAAAAFAHVNGALQWYDHRGDPHLVVPDQVDDVVLVRKDIGISYHLAVVVDDAEQGIDMVIRGEDLREATPVQLLLQHLLALPHPRYLHHPLIRDAQGNRLAKRNHATTLAGLREAGVTAAALREFLTHHRQWNGYPNSALAASSSNSDFSTRR